jgi:hypothetical protein
MAQVVSSLQIFRLNFHINEDCILLTYEGVSRTKRTPTFQRNVVFSCWKNEETSSSDNPLIHRHILEERIRQLHRCRNVKTRLPIFSRLQATCYRFHRCLDLNIGMMFGEKCVLWLNSNPQR